MNKYRYIVIFIINGTFLLEIVEADSFQGAINAFEYKDYTFDEIYSISKAL